MVFKMSFSSEVKEELENIMPGAGHCKQAELAGIMQVLWTPSSDRESITVSADDSPAIRKCFTILNKTYNINTEIFTDTLKKVRNSVLLTKENFPVKGILNEIDFTNPERHLKKDCCKRAYLRGLFLACGFISDPEKGYHFEMKFDDKAQAERVINLFKEFSIDAKQSVRRNDYIVYIKESNAVSDVLSIMGAHTSMMNFVNEKIVRNVRNRTNRRVNCEAANIAKTVDASGRQIEDIMYIRDKVGLEALPDSLRIMAEIRLEHADESLSSLGKFLNPPVGKSGVNHRLRKISEFADSLR